MRVFKTEEDARLTTRLDAFANPVVVATLVSGFALFLFEYASRESTRQLALIAFAFEMAACMILSAIAFHGQQLYSYATNKFPITRKFLHRVVPITVCALGFFALGVVIFVVAFLLEASDDLGDSWMTLVTVVFGPSLITCVLFAASVMVLRRNSMEDTE